EHDDRIGTAFPNQRKITFNSAEIKIRIKATDQENRVNIGSQNLLFRFRTCNLSGEFILSPQNIMDRCFVLQWSGLYDHPVAYSRKILPTGGLETHPSTNFCPDLTMICVKYIMILMLDGHAANHVPLVPVRRKASFKKGIPTKSFQSRVGHSQ